MEGQKTSEKFRRFLYLYGEFLLYGLNFIPVGGSGLIPALCRHFSVYVILHTEAFAERIAESFMHICRAGFYCTVHIQIAYSFFEEQQSFH